MAKSLGLKIDTSNEHRVHLELPGQRIVRTSGVVADVDWRFGEGKEKDRHLVNFYVLEGLAVDLVLDEELLWNTNAFQAYEDCTIELDDERCDCQEWLYLTIRLAKQRKSMLSRLLGKDKDVEQPTELETWRLQRDELLAEARGIQMSSQSAQEKQAEIQDVDKRLSIVQRQRPRKNTAHTVIPDPSSGMY